MRRLLVILLPSTAFDRGRHLFEGGVKSKKYGKCSLVSKPKINVVCFDEKFTVLKLLAVNFNTVCARPANTLERPEGCLPNERVT